MAVVCWMLGHAIFDTFLLHALTLSGNIGGF